MNMISTHSGPIAAMIRTLIKLLNTPSGVNLVMATLKRLLAALIGA